MRFLFLYGVLGFAVLITLIVYEVSSDVLLAALFAFEVGAVFLWAWIEHGVRPRW